MNVLRKKERLKLNNLTNNFIIHKLYTLFDLICACSTMDPENRKYQKKKKSTEKSAFFEADQSEKRYETRNRRKNGTTSQKKINKLN